MESSRTGAKPAHSNAAAATSTTARMALRQTAYPFWSSNSIGVVSQSGVSSAVMISATRLMPFSNYQPFSGCRIRDAFENPRNDDVRLTVHDNRTATQCDHAVGNAHVARPRGSQ